MLNCNCNDYDFAVIVTALVACPRMARVRHDVVIVVLPVCGRSILSMKGTLCRRGTCTRFTTGFDPLKYILCDVLYSGFISREKIFKNFTDLLLCMQILFVNTVSPLRCGSSTKIQSTKFYSRNALMPLICEKFTHKTNPLYGVHELLTFHGNGSRGKIYTYVYSIHVAFSC